MIKILFFANRRFHLPHLVPTALWLHNNKKDLEVSFSSPVNGLRKEDITELKNYGFQWIEKSKVSAWNPDVTVLADMLYKKIPWNGKKVNVNHGLICKGFFYTQSRFVRRDNAADLVCVPGKFHADKLKKLLNIPVVNTGFVKFDKIANGEISKELARNNYGIPNDVELVAFTPTFNKELSAVPIVTHTVRNLIKENRYLLIKLHELSHPSWFKLYQKLSNVEEKIIFTEDKDITPVLVAADVVISDVSSAGMEAMALNKPVVLVDSPYQKKFYNFNEKDVEYTWRDFSLRVKNILEMEEAVEQSFLNPDDKEALRLKYAENLVGKLDGEASKRTAEVILKICVNNHDAD